MSSTREEFGEIEDVGHVAIIRHISEDKRVIHFSYTNLSKAEGKASFSEPCSFSEGEFIHVNNYRNSITPTPSQPWSSNSPWIGTVRLVTPNLTIIESGGQLRRVPTLPLSQTVRVGNTVEATLSGVSQVLSATPLNTLRADLPADIASKYRRREEGLEYSDIGGLDSTIRRARELIELPIHSPELFEKIGVAPTRGVLLTGPPGTGKTMLSRTLACKLNATFYNINGPEIVGKYVGETEEVLRAIFEDAQAQDSAVIFFDEIDSISSARTSESHDYSRRTVAQLLTLIDGFSPRGRVIVLAATNRPEDVDMALRRPGRFDAEIRFGYPTREGRRQILEKTSRNKTVADNLPYDQIASRTEGWSGAELVAIWREAALLAVSDKRQIILPEDFLGGMNRLATLRKSKETL